MAERLSDWDKAARLVEKAIRRLPEREQSTVLRYLLRGLLDLRYGEAQPPAALQRTLRAVAPSAFELAPLISQPAMMGPGREHQTLPVRLPEEQYSRLKEWCSEQGFSMATVIRGLVESFLEAQGRPKREV